ncbi:MAG: transglutaminase-like domain-containing protein [Dysgonamonadaceae bacterium]|jgi:hypothetical protein|nr:transglutaminase-like domain-containing protein [Dysgonamonadaceae bacterium]
MRKYFISSGILAVFQQMRPSFTLLIICLFFSCTRDSIEIKQALELAGNNRYELEKVLAHYSRDSSDCLKLQAAKFLIMNMRGKYSLDTLSMAANQPYFDALTNYLQDHDSYSHETMCWILDSVKLQLQNHWQQPIPQYLSDLKTLHADYLIRHIDRAFETWTKHAWSKTIPFDVFCRYILPYKSHDGLWEGAFPYYEEKYNSLPESVTKLTAREIGEYMDRDIKRTFLNDGAFFREHYPFLKPSDFRNIIQARLGDCQDNNAMSITALRTMGIPAVLNSLPLWGNSNARHFWTEMPVSNIIKEKYDNTQRPYTNPKNILINDMFWFDDPMTDMYGDIPQHITVRSCRTVPKVFRDGFAIQATSLACKTTEPVPDFFRNLCLEDITGQYIECANVAVHFPEKPPGKYAYLCCYNPDNRAWTPVDWAEVRNKKAVFNNMGINVCYVPACYTDKRIVETGDAFILSADGQQRILRADKNRLKTAELYSKVPYRSQVMFWAGILKGSSIAAANRTDLSDTVVLHRIEHLPVYGQEVNVSRMQPARYVIFRFADKRFGFLAELEFRGLDGQGREVKLQGRPFGNPGIYGSELDKAFDNDRVSFFFEAKDREPYIGLDFGKSVTVTKIIYWPRSDDNGIVPGELYELFYWDQGWQSLGRQTGRDDYRLIYDNVPDNALLRIHNHTRGKEHRPFTYENGKQVWW